MNKETIAIIGTGLMGCSFAHGLNNRFNIVGVDSDKTTIALALSKEFINSEDEIEMAVAKAAIVIVATPVNITAALISNILSMIGKEVTVIDLGSTKHHICSIVANHPKREQYVACHPMAGSEKSGPLAASKDLLHGQPIFICEEDRSSNNALARAFEIFRLLNLRPTFISPLAHEQVMAEVSHLPQVAAFGLAAALSSEPGNVEYAGNGFNSATRLAGSSAAVWNPILFQNKENVLKALAKLQNTLDQIAECIETEDAVRLSSIIREANQVRKKFELGETNK
jgi:prephenate dehydrogenase